MKSGLALDAGCKTLDCGIEDPVNRSTIMCKPAGWYPKIVRGNGSMNKRANEAIDYIPSSFTSKCAYMRCIERKKPVSHRRDTRDIIILIYA